VLKYLGERENNGKEFYNQQIAQELLEEMIARALKDTFQEQLRKTMKMVRIPSEGLYLTSVFIIFIRSLF